MNLHNTGFILSMICGLVLLYGCTPTLGYVLSSKFLIDSSNLPENLLGLHIIIPMMIGFTIGFWLYILPESPNDIRIREYDSEHP
jgi:hypothetical protein